MEACVVLLVLLFCSPVTVEVASTSPCGDQASVVVAGGGKVDGDGGLVADDGTRFPPGCYWRSKSSVTLGCPNLVKPCFWKCCLDDETLNDSGKSCTPHNETRSHPFLPTPTPAGNFNISNYHLLKSHYCYGKGFQLDNAKTSYVIDENATISVTQASGVAFQVPAGGYCLEDSKSGTPITAVVFVCVPRKDKDKDNDVGEKEEPRIDATFYIYSVARIISLPFLVATLVVYAVIPELRNLHGKCLISHLTSLTVAFVFLLIIQLASNQISKRFCVASALIIYYFMLGSFFWLNVMCFDIWWTFSGNKRMVGRKSANDEKRGFILYSLYAWGVPFVMLCVCAVLDFSSHVPKTALRPEFGTQKCWFKDKPTSLAYFYGPAGVLLASNIAFFGVTAFNIFRIKKETAVLSGSESQKNVNQESGEKRFLLYIKLFVVMGLSWCLDLIGWAIGGPDYIWWVSDIVNILQGIPIFIIFVWKARVRKLLGNKFNCKVLHRVVSSPTVSTELS